MGMTSGSSKELRADINVTPLIDVLLVLLIIFMVIQPTAVVASTLSYRTPPNPLIMLNSRKQSLFRSSATQTTE
jgi:biopolymer transport protein ExbD